MKNFLILVFPIIAFVLLLTGCSNDVNDNDVDIDVDIDLSSLSQTIIQAEYQRIVANADDNIGKSIMLLGTYQSVFIEGDGDYAHFIIIVQGDECCQMGFEFKRKGDYSFPDDYPEQNTVILITGVLDTLERFGSTYLYVDVDDFSVKSN